MYSPALPFQIIGVVLIKRGWWEGGGGGPTDNLNINTREGGWGPNKRGGRFENCSQSEVATGSH